MQRFDWFAGETNNRNHLQKVTTSILILCKRCHCFQHIWYDDGCGGKASAKTSQKVGNFEMWPDNKDNKQQRRVNQTLEKTEIVNKDTISGNPVSSKHSGNKTKLSVLRLGWFDSQQGITLVNGALQSVLFVRISVVAWLCGTPPQANSPHIESPHCPIHTIQWRGK